MRDVTIYLFAPKRKGLKWVRELQIDEARTGKNLYSATIRCDKNTTDQCWIINGRVEAIV